MFAIVKSGANGNGATSGRDLARQARKGKPASSWRDDLPIHPAAELFPLMPPDELRELGEDIKVNGLISPITITSDGKLLDGRNRLDAMELVGLKFEIARGYNGSICIKIGADGLSWPEIVKSDPYAFVISANIRRRHLNVEQRQHLLIELIACAPEKSDRQIGKEVGVDHKTIARARTKGEDVGRIPHVEMRTDAKGRKQPATKLLRPKKTSPATGQIPHARAIPNKAQKLTRHDVFAWFGTASVVEHQRLFDDLGARVVAAAIPPYWNMRLASAGESVGQITAQQHSELMCAIAAE